MKRVTATIRRYAQVAAWLLLAGALAPLGTDLAGRLDSIAVVDGAQHARVSEHLERDFDTAFDDPDILVLHGADGDPGDEALRAVVAAIDTAAPDSRILSALDTGDPLLRGRDGSGALVYVSFSGGAADAEAARARARAAVADAVHSLADAGRGIEAGWTGPRAVNAALRDVGAEDSAAAEQRVLPFVFVVLVLVFGSILASLLPVFVGILTVTIAVGVLAILADHLPLNSASTTVAAMLGLALSIDFSLLLVVRFREERERGADLAEALRRTRRHAGGAVRLSGISLSACLAALLVVPINEIRSIALGGLVVTVVAVAVASTLTPAALALFGERMVALGRMRATVAARSRQLWSGWGRLVSARPLAVFLVGLLPMLFLVAHGLRIDLGMPEGDWLPDRSPAVTALHEMGEIGRDNLFDAMPMTIGFDPKSTFEERLRAMTALTARIAATEGIEALRPDLRTPGIPADISGFVSRDGTSALLVAVPSPKLSNDERDTLIRRLRDLSPPAPIREIMVGGAPALDVDYKDAVLDHIPIVGALIVMGAFMALAIGYRSIVLPLKAVALNLLSVGAALGALVLVYQDAALAPLVGPDQGYGHVFPNIPILAFAIVFGLSMDYEVFLFSRVKEAHLAGADDSAALVSGLVRTGGVITSAAIIMLAVFGGFMLGDFLFVQMLGFTLACAILLDAIIVRLTLGPAIFILAGRWNWWPSGGQVAARTA